MIRGDDRIFDFTVTRKDVNGVPQVEDITGAKLWFTGKLEFADANGVAIPDNDSANTVFQKSGVMSGTDSGIAQTAANKGRVTLSKSDTKGLPNRRTTLKYDLQMLKTGQINTLDSGF